MKREGITDRRVVNDDSNHGRSCLVIGLKPQRISQRITTLAKQAGITHKLAAHSGRVGLASELTARGASATETMLAGNWKTARMVAHYSTGAKAQRGKVAKFL